MNPQPVREYHVPSATDPHRTYLVAEGADGRLDCDCPDRQFRHNYQCKHVVAVQSGLIRPDALTGQVAEAGARPEFRRVGRDLLMVDGLTAPVAV